MNDFRPLPEQNRRHYLEAMGISSWYPRVRLPAAPLPITFDLDETEYAGSPAAALVRESNHSSAQTARVDSTAQTAAQVPDSEPLTPDTGPIRDNTDSTAAPQIIRSVAAPVPRFALSLSIVGDFLIADSLARGLSQPTETGQQLLLNILATLGVSAADVRTHHVVQWPLFTNRKVDQGLEQARIYVDEKLDQFIRQYQPTTLLSFGAVMPRLQGWQQPKGDYGEVPWVGLPSLYQMLNDPLKKAVCWRRLKPLVPTTSLPD